MQRMFHVSSSDLAHWRNNDASGLRAPKKQRSVKKEKRTQHHVDDAPYVTPKHKLTVKNFSEND